MLDPYLPYLPYLLRWWNEGCRSAKRLHAEIHERGYRHSVDTLNRLLSSLRYTEKQGGKPFHAPRTRRGTADGASPTAKNVATLFIRREEMLNAEEKEYLQKLCVSDSALAGARRLTQDFARMVRHLWGEKLDGWLEEAEASAAGVMRKFAAGLKKDLDAVRARPTEERSNGPVEGFVNKLKLVKHRDYVRAGFGLLRARMLAARPLPETAAQGRTGRLTKKPTEPPVCEQVGDIPRLLPHATVAPSRRSAAFLGPVVVKLSSKPPRAATEGTET